MSLERISRRRILKVTGGALALAVLSPFEALAQSSSPSPETGFETGVISLGPEINLSLKYEGLTYAPDGHTSFITLPVTLPDGTESQIKRYFITSNISTYTVETDGKSLREAIEGGEVTAEKVKEVYGQDPAVEYRRHYGGITSVHQLDVNNLYHLTAITHNENRGTDPDAAGAYQATVGLLESFDGGLTWEDRGVIITGDDLAEPGTRVSGAGQPNAIQIGNELYIYYVDWSAGINYPHADQIYLAKAGINEQSTIDTDLEFYTSQGFVKGQNFDLEPVIPVPATVDGAGYSALPSVSYNTHLNKYLCVFETNVGFCQTTSIDGINWDEPVLFAKFPQAQGVRQPKDEWFSYPTFASDSNQPNDHVTERTGILLYSKGLWNLRPHNLVAREVEIK